MLIRCCKLAEFNHTGLVEKNLFTQETYEWTVSNKAQLQASKVLETLFCWFLYFCFHTLVSTLHHFPLTCSLT